MRKRAWIAAGLSLALWPAAGTTRADENTVAPSAQAVNGAPEMTSALETMQAISDDDEETMRQTAKPGAAADLRARIAEKRKSGDTAAELDAWTKLFALDAGGDFQTATNDLIGMGFCHERAGHHIDAVNCFIAAAVQSHRVHDQQNELILPYMTEQLADRCGHPEAVIDAYKGALRSFEGNRDPDAQAWITRHIGQEYLHGGNYAAAITPLKTALSLQIKTGNRHEQGGILFDMGTAYNALDKPALALVNLEKALATFRELKADKDTASTLEVLGALYRKQQKYAKALDLYNEARSLIPPDKVRLPSLLCSIGSVYYDQGKYDDALPFYEQALAIYRQANLPETVSETLLSIGLTQLYRGKLTEADTAFQECLTDYRKGELTSEETLALLKIGTAYCSLGRFGLAIAYAEKALAILKPLSNAEGEAFCLNNLGIAYEQLGNHEKARAYYDQAISVAHAAKATALEIKILGNAASVDDGRYNIAIERLNKALAFYQEIGDRRQQSLVLHNLAISYSLSGDTTRAMDHAKRSEALARSIGDRSAEALAIAVQGYIHLGQVDFKHAIADFQTALTTGAASMDKEHQCSILAALGEVYARLHLDTIAIYYDKRAVNGLQSIRRGITDASDDLQRGFLVSASKSYRRLCELLIAHGRLPEAHFVMRMLKEDEFLDYVRRDAGEARSDQLQVALAPIEADWQKRYVAVADKVTAIGEQRAALLVKQQNAKDGGEAFTAADAKALAQCEADLQVANKAFNQFVEKLQTEAEALQKRGAKVAVTAQAMQDAMGVSEALDPGTVALYTIVEPDKYRVVLVTGQTQKAEEYAISSGELAKKIFAFREALQNPGLDPRPMGKELYDILLGPVQKDLDGAHATTLLWSLDGPLRYLPIAALYDGGKYVVERYATGEFTGASLPRLGLADHDKWTGLGLGVTQEHTVTDSATGEALTFAALGGVPDELSTVIADKPNARGAIPGATQIDAAFTRMSLLQGLDSQHPQVVHIASHFAFRPGQDEDSFLLLGDGSQLTLSDIKTMPRLFSGVDLLTLSACETAMGDTADDGREVEGLGIIAQRQGAHAVLATLWQVSDAATPEFMRRFYTAHQVPGHAAKAQALRQAQLGMLAGKGGVQAAAPAAKTQPAAAHPDAKAEPPRYVKDPNAPFAHPYYWAPFILIGNWK